MVDATRTRRSLLASGRAQIARLSAGIGLRGREGGIDDDNRLQAPPEADATGEDPVSTILGGALERRGTANSLTHSRARQLSSVARVNGPTSSEGVELLELVRRHPDDALLQIYAARASETHLGPKTARDMWDRLRLRFPDWDEPIRMTLRWTIRERGRDAGQAWMQTAIAGRPATFRTKLLQAQLTEEFRLESNVSDAYDDLLQEYPEEEQAYVAYARWLNRTGHIGQAAAILREGIDAAYEADRLRQMLTEVQPKLANLGRIVGPLTPGRTIGELALERVLARMSSSELRPLPAAFASVGRVAMITGSLGAGGAEKQLAITSVALSKAARSGDSIGDFDVLGPVSVLSRSLDSRSGGDFFRGQLMSEGIDIEVYQDLPEYGGHRERSIVAPFRALVPHLAPQMREGTLKLADRLNVLSPQVVHIWQDGSILAASLAALLARAPRIVLGLRTLPPADREGRNRPEYPVLYRGMLSMPGVRLVANSRFAAERFRDWLEAPEGAIKVVHNGMQALSDEPRSDSQTLLQKFDAATAPSDFTLGTVMRFDENKRPFLWLDAAARLLQRFPSSRFILIGDGPMWQSAKEHAAAAGIAQRTLFLGTRVDVGFWLRQFSAFVLLSRHEGLPNVLIEAQMAGVPAVCTPAGGSRETIVPDGQEFVLARADEVDVAEVAGKLERLRDPGLRRELGERARTWSREAFSVEKMITATVALYCE